MAAYGGGSGAYAHTTHAIRQLDWFSHFCTADATFSLQITLLLKISDIMSILYYYYNYYYSYYYHSYLLSVSMQTKSTSAGKALRRRRAESTDCSRENSVGLCTRCNGRSLSARAAAVNTPSYLVQQLSSRSM